jgi:hypothetical protein
MKDCGQTQVKTQPLTDLEYRLAISNQSVKLKNMHQVIGMLEDAKRKIRQADMFLIKHLGINANHLGTTGAAIDRLTLVQNKIQKEFFS